MKITLVILTMNEIQGIREILPKINHSLFNQILIVDGGSTDGTVEYAQEHGYEIYIQQKKGIRYAYLEILSKIQGDIIITFSPDGNSPPEALSTLIDKIQEGYDLVICSRYLQNAKSYDDSLLTGFGNWLFTKTVNFLHNAQYTDAMVIYRAFKKDLIYQLKLDKEESYTLPERLFKTVISWEPLMSVRAAKHKLKVTEIPVDEPERIGGKSKLQVLRWGAAYYFQFFYEKFVV